MKTYTVKLTRTEIDHIQWAVAHLAEEVYYGPKPQYLARCERIIRNLEAVVQALSDGNS